MGGRRKGEGRGERVEAVGRRSGVGVDLGRRSQSESESILNGGDNDRLGADAPEHGDDEDLVAAEEMMMMDLMMMMRMLMLMMNLGRRNCCCRRRLGMDRMRLMRLSL